MTVLPIGRDRNPFLDRNVLWWQILPVHDYALRLLAPQAGRLGDCEVHEGRTGVRDAVYDESCRM